MNDAAVEKRLARGQAFFTCFRTSSTYPGGVTDRRSVIVHFRTLLPVSRTHDPLFRLSGIPAACLSPNNGSSVRSAAKMACFSEIAEPVSVSFTVRQTYCPLGPPDPRKSVGGCVGAPAPLSTSNYIRFHTFSGGCTSCASTTDPSSRRSQVENSAGFSSSSRITRAPRSMPSLP